MLRLCQHIYLLEIGGLIIWSNSTGSLSTFSPETWLKYDWHHELSEYWLALDTTNDIIPWNLKARHILFCFSLFFSRCTCSSNPHRAPLHGLHNSPAWTPLCVKSFGERCVGGVTGSWCPGFWPPKRGKVNENLMCVFPLNLHNLHGVYSCWF